MGTRIMLDEIQKKLDREDLTPEMRNELLKRKEILLNDKEIEK